MPPHIARVHLWPHLSLPPIQRIDGERPNVVADVIIETEHAVWTLVSESAGRDVTDSEAAMATVDAGGCFAGVRHHYCGVIQSSESNAVPWFRSADSIFAVCGERSVAVSDERSSGPDPRPMGRDSMVRVGRPDAGLLRGRQSAPIERALARNALQWLTSVGIDPAVRSVPAAIDDFRVRAVFQIRNAPEKGGPTARRT